MTDQITPDVPLEVRCIFLGDEAVYETAIGASRQDMLPRATAPKPNVVAPFRVRLEAQAKACGYTM